MANTRFNDAQVASYIQNLNPDQVQNSVNVFGIAPDQLQRAQMLLQNNDPSIQAARDAYNQAVANNPQAHQQNLQFYNPQTNQGTGADNVNFVRNLYSSLLGRQPDQEGLNYWSNQLQTGAKTPQQIEQEFRNTPEFKQKSGTPNTSPATTPLSSPNPYGNNPYLNSNNPYIQAAQQTSAGNLANAQAATSANRVNQNTPFGSVNFAQTGVDANGNPIWSATQQLAPGLQNAFQNIQSNVTQSTAKPFDVSQTQQQMANNPLPQFQQIGARPDLQTSVEGTGMEGWDKANELMMNRLRPQMEQREDALDAKLANRGIMPGTEAYNRARLALSQANNDLMIQSQLAGSQVQNQLFNQNLNAGRFRNEALTGQNTMGLANLGFNNQANQTNFANQMAQLQASNQARQGNYQQNLAAYNNPLQQLAAFREGTNPNFVNYYNQPAVMGPNYSDAYSTSVAQQIAAQNAANAADAARQSGLYSLGSAALMGGGGLGGLFNLGKQAIGGIGSGIDWLSGLSSGSSLSDYGATAPWVSSADFMSNLAGSATPFTYTTPTDFLDELLNW